MGTSAHKEDTFKVGADGVGATTRAVRRDHEPTSTLPSGAGLASQDKIR